MTPLVSIITATYNRSNVLQYTIRSVLDQTFSNWEMLIVGDGCTDDTEQVVAAFQDSRIRFIKLPENIGEQSGPNNEGLKQARGEFVAMLNHDDLWFPDHLQRGLDALRQPKTDVVIGMGVVVNPDSSFQLYGVFPDNRYRPVDFVPASGWLFRKSLLEEVGYWRSFRHLWIYPSQDWLIRAYKAGKHLVPTHHLTWLAVPSGVRKNVYLDREEFENRQYYYHISTNPSFREQILTAVAVATETQNRRFPVGSLWRQGVKNLIIRQLINLGLLPVQVRFMVRYWRRGGALNALRKMRGLSKI
ncbi:glycosyltransferase family 2 protein [Larkinella sp. VNQ87]|uniref:glycosyltransferase family 2 protein n=1 Tax=Larkinella sp. VNQ87 TaxID=3400921 RepID=UPI003C0DA2B5